MQNKTKQNKNNPNHIYQKHYSKKEFNDPQ